MSDTSNKKQGLDWLYLIPRRLRDGDLFYLQHMWSSKFANSDGFHCSLIHHAHYNETARVSFPAKRLVIIIHQLVCKFQAALQTDNEPIGPIIDIVSLHGIIVELEVWTESTSSSLLVQKSIKGFRRNERRIKNTLSVMNEDDVQIIKTDILKA